MGNLSLRVSLLLCTLLLLAMPLTAQDSLLTPAYKQRISLGVEVPSMLVHRFVHKGYAFQPMLLADVGPATTLWVGGGVMQIRRDTVFNNLFEYRSKGWYVKGGGDLKINFRHNSGLESGLRFGAGISIAHFRETGSIVLRYTDDEVSRDPEANSYTKMLENSSWTAALEFRQGIFIDLGKSSLLFQLQESVLLREPDNPEHTTFYIPGTGVLSPKRLFGRGNVGPISIIPAAYVYFFFRLQAY